MFSIIKARLIFVMIAGGLTFMTQGCAKKKFTSLNSSGVQAVNPNEQIMRVAVMADGAVYYGETTMPFLKYQTSFNKDFRD